MTLVETSSDSITIYWGQSVVYGPFGDWPFKHGGHWTMDSKHFLEEGEGSGFYLDHIGCFMDTQALIQGLWDAIRLGWTPIVVERPSVGVLGFSLGDIWVQEVGCERPVTTPSIYKETLARVRFEGRVYEIGRH